MAGWTRVGILILWMVVVCLGENKVADPSKCPVTSIISVSDLGRASIPCPPFIPDKELRFHLFLNFSSIFELDKNTESAGIQFLSVNGSSHFEIQLNSSGLYSCRREVMYPPPHTEDCQTTAVWVSESPNWPVTSVQRAQPSCPGVSVPHVLLLAGCCVLLVYSLSITVTCIVIWRKLKQQEEDESEYVNTKPGEFKRPYKV